jgi:hypothetical protein
MTGTLDCHATLAMTRPMDCRAALAMTDVGGGRVTARPQAVAVYLRRLLMKAMYARQQDGLDGIHIFVMARLLQLL